MSRRYVECACSDPRHTLIFEPGDELGEIIVYASLNPRAGFWRRVRWALGYLFAPRAGIFHEETILTAEQVRDVLAMAEVRDVPLPQKDVVR